MKNVFSLCALVIFSAFTSAANADDVAQQPEYLACAWGDASFEGDCRNSSVAAEAEMAALAKVAMQRKQPTNAPSAAAGSKYYSSHPYPNGGYFGERMNGDRE